MNISEVKTMWALGVPAPYRPALSAAYPDITFHFITITKPLADSSKRIQDAPASAVGSWNGIGAEDYEAFTARFKLPRFRIGGGGAFVQAKAGQPQLTPLGFYIEPEDKRSADPASESVRKLTARGGKVYPAQLAAAKKLIPAFVKSGISMFNYGTPRTVFSPARRMFLIVADDISEFTKPSAARFDAYLSLLADCRKRHPDKDVVFVVNGDYEMPTHVINRIVSDCDVVLHEYYSPRLLKSADAVGVHSSVAGLDALLYNKKVECVGPSPAAGVLRGDSPVPLEQAFAATYLAYLRYVEPTGGAKIEPAKLSDVIPRTLGKMPAPIKKPPVAWSLGKTSTKAPSKTSASAPKALVKPAAAISPPKAAPSTSNRKPVKDNDQQSSAVTSAAPLAPPAWLLPEALDRPDIGKIVYLEPDAAILPSLLQGVRMQATPLRLHPDGGRTGLREIEDFALGQPELFSRIVERRLRLSGATEALIFNLESSAVRLFTRCCARLGITRIYVPPFSLGADAANWRGLLPMASSSTTLFDVALAWDKTQIDCLVGAGFPRDHIVAVTLPSAGRIVQEEKRKKLITVSLSQLPVSAANSAATLSVCVRQLLTVSESFGFQIAFYFGGDLVNLLTDDLLTRISRTDRAVYEIFGGERIELDHRLAVSAVQIADCELALAAADAARTPTIFVRWDMPDEAVSPMVVNTPNGIQSALLRWMDELAPASDYQLLADAVPMETCLSGRDGVAWPKQRLGTAAQIATSESKLPLALVASTVSHAEWEGRQQHLAAMLPAVARRRLTRTSTIGEFSDVDIVLQWGIRPDPTKAIVDAMRQRIGIDRLFIEDGFIRSIDIGLMEEPTLSIIVDDMTVYYDATRASRLETILNSDFALENEQYNRATSVIYRINETKVSKYNFAPYKDVKIGRPGVPKILVVDQRAGDQSITSGLADESSFQRMVAAALDLTPDYDIIVKTHPDANVAGKDSAIGHALLNLLAGNPYVSIVTEDMNPYSLIDICEKVFVVTSGMGFEALIAGREVRCFGAPFYAGWGLTTDEVSVPRRTVRRNIQEVFYTTYIILSRYFVPSYDRAGSVEELIDYIVGVRPWSLDSGSAIDHQASSLEPRPVKSLVTPMQDMVLKPGSIIWAANFTAWKHDFVRRVFDEYVVEFIPQGESLSKSAGKINASIDPVFVVWGRNAMPGLVALARQNNIPIYRMEDGFVRSVGLGANKILPYSFCLDSRGIYFDATVPSDLEVLLANYQFGDAEVEAARAAIDLMVHEGVSKYNFPIETNDHDVYGEKTAKRVLVIGQVEDDASIKFGAPPGVTNNDLVRLARAENPDAQVIYKIHPDVLAGRRAYNSDPGEVADICEIRSESLSLHEAFSGVDQVYTFTSLAGFEALLRGIPVTTVGAPFYAGWGLTDTRMETPRRGRTLSLEQLFYGVYMLYAKYMDPNTGAPITLMDAIAAIVDERGSINAVLDDQDQEEAELEELVSPS